MKDAGGLEPQAGYVILGLIRRASVTGWHNHAAIMSLAAEKSTVIVVPYSSTLNSAMP